MCKKALKNLWLSLAAIITFALFNNAHAGPGSIYLTMDNQLSHKVLFTFKFQNENTSHAILFDKGNSSTSVSVDSSITANMNAYYAYNIQQLPCSVINSGNYTPQTLSVVINKDYSCQATLG